jgi:putative transposase
LRRHWNYALGERLDWLNRTRSLIDRCSIISEPIGEIPAQIDYYTQQAALKETKVLFPAYKDIYCETQQINLQRLDKAWQRWMVPDKLESVADDRDLRRLVNCGHLGFLGLTIRKQLAF